MSDRVTFGKRKYLLLIIPVLLLLGWFAFAPGNDHKNTDDKDVKTSQKQESKDKDDKTEGQVEAASTTEPSTPPATTTTSSTWRPSPNVKVASVVTGAPQQPAPQTPPTSPTGSQEPECTTYDSYSERPITIALKPGDRSQCYVLTNENEQMGCWIPVLPYAFAENPNQLYWFGELLDANFPWEEMSLPYIVIEDRSVLDLSGLPEDLQLPEGMDVENLCPTYGKQMQFRVYAPTEAVSLLPGDEHDYTLPVMNIAFDLDDLVESTNNESEPNIDFACHDVLVNITGEGVEDAYLPGDELNCDTLLDFIPPVVALRD